MPPKNGREPMVPAAAVREIAERWLLGFETPEDAYQRLAANSTVQADSWRKRFTMTWAPGRKRMPPGVDGPAGVMYPVGWWADKELRESDVEEFLTAAGLMHLWFEPPLGKPLSEIRPSDEEFDAPAPEQVGVEAAEREAPQAVDGTADSEAGASGVPAAHAARPELERAREAAGPDISIRARGFRPSARNARESAAAHP